MSPLHSSPFRSHGWWKKMPISEIPPNYQPNKNGVFFNTIQGSSSNPTTSDSKLAKLSTFLEVWESYLLLRAMHRSSDFLFNPKLRVTITCLDRLEYNQSKPMYMPDDFPGSPEKTKNDEEMAKWSGFPMKPPKKGHRNPPWFLDNSSKGWNSKKNQGRLLWLSFFRSI